MKEKSVPMVATGTRRGQCCCGGCHQDLRDANCRGDGARQGVGRMTWMWDVSDRVPVGDMWALRWNLSTDETDAMMKWYTVTRWWFHSYFLFSPRTLGKMYPILTCIFFRWVGSTTNQGPICSPFWFTKSRTK